MNKEELKIIGNWLSEWSDDKSEIEYLRRKIEEEASANNSNNTLLRERDDAVRDLVKTKQKLGAAVLLMSDFFTRLTNNKKITKKDVSSMIDRLKEYQAKNNVIIIEDGMAK